MGLFKKKVDPVSERSKQLNAQIEALELQIRQLSTRIDHARSHPRVRSTSLPNGPTVDMGPAAAPSAPIFEQVQARSVKNQPEVESNASHYNDLGVRKYDLFGAVKRFYSHFRAPATTNPKLVSYLAAGSIKGLRPLRYEKRVARNRFLLLTGVFFAVLWGIIYFVFIQH